MKFLADVNASGSLADWLSGMGYDIARVSDVDPRMVDDDILRWAIRDGRVIITTDQDFEQKIWQEGKQHKGILRLENLPRAERMALLQDVLHHNSRDLESGAIVIAKSRKIRIRKSFSG